MRKKVWLEGFQDYYKYREDGADVLYNYPAQAELDTLDKRRFCWRSRCWWFREENMEAILVRHFQFTRWRWSVLTKSIKIPKMEMQLVYRPYKNLMNETSVCESKGCYDYYVF